MHSRYVTLIQSSFAEMQPVRDQVADLFYARVFEQHPEYRALFPQDMAQQKIKLMAMLSYIVESLLALDALIPTLQELGKRHKSYGVIPEYYQPLGSALIWAFEQTLGERFTPETRRAWIGVYSMMANSMLQGAATDEESGEA
jgi:hemoglobin-like flavoprotein